jgi:hypothetical protein
MHAAMLRLALALALVAMVLPASSARPLAAGRRGRDAGRHIRVPTLASILEGEADSASDVADGESSGSCITVEFPLKFRTPVDFNVNEGFGPLKDVETDLECHCEEYTCSCDGEGRNCDEYSQAWFYALAYAHQFGSFFYALPQYEQEYHLQAMAFWIVLGLVLSWLGIIMVVYIEIKAVAITRARDERAKLMQIRAMEPSAKIEQLGREEMKVMTPRPYITLCGGILLFIGLFCELIPFCHLLRELGLPVAFHGACPLFVFVYAATLAATGVLLLLGAIWSCTRGWAALLFVALALAGDVLMLAGLYGCLAWGVLAAAVLWAYFAYLPESMKANAYVSFWVQGVGEFRVDADLGKVQQAFAEGGGILTSDLTENPVGEHVSSPTRAPPSPPPTAHPADPSADPQARAPCPTAVLTSEPLVQPKQVKELRKRFVPEAEGEVEATLV